MRDDRTEAEAEEPDDELRLEAEALLRKRLLPSGPIPPEDAPRVLHELQVHQIELELQNDELRRTQVALDASRTRYFDLYDLAPVGYITLSKEGLILESNLTAAGLLGVPRGQLIQRPLRHFIHSDDLNRYYQYRMQCSAGEGPQVCEFRLLRADGVSFWARMEATAALDGEGTPVRRAVLSNITEQKQAEAALRQAHDTLEQRVAERTAELSAALQKLGLQSERVRSLTSELTLIEQRERGRLGETLHDGLQQLLVAIRMRAHMLGSTDDPRVREGAHEIVEMLQEALAQTRSLTAELGPPSLRIGGLHAGLDWLAQWSEERHHLRVRVKGPATPPPPLSEDLAVLLFRSARELIFNAVKYAGVSEVDVILAQDGQSLTLTVADAGVGFDPSLLRGEGGVHGGFGLAGIRHRLELLGGCMHIDSAPGQGARITLAVLLPNPGDTVRDPHPPSP